MKTQKIYTMIDPISMQTENPWREFEMLVDYSNLILNNEKDIIRKFNESLGDTESLNFKEYSIHEDIVPAPFMGDVYNSPIVLLTLNPGWDPKEEALGFYEQYRDVWLKMIQCPNIPLFCLDSEYRLKSPYWVNKLKHQIENSGIEKISKNIAVIQLFPYQSKSYKPINKKITKDYLPSQKFNFKLVKMAMDRNALILILRSKSLWYSAVEGLESYENKAILKNPRNPVLSKNNLSNAYETIIDILK